MTKLKVEQLEITAAPIEAYHAVRLSDMTGTLNTGVQILRFSVDGGLAASEVDFVPRVERGPFTSVVLPWASHIDFSLLRISSPWVAGSLTMTITVGGVEIVAVTDLDVSIEEYSDVGTEVFFNGTTDQIQCGTDGVAVVFENVENTVTAADHGMITDTPFYFTTDNALPAEFTAGTIYYAIKVTDAIFKVSATPAGAAIDFTGNGVGNNYFHIRLEHSPANNTLVRFSTSNTLPVELATGTNYYVIHIDNYLFQIETAIGSGAINFTGSGTGTHRMHEEFNWSVAYADSTDAAYDVADGVEIGVLLNTSVGWNPITASIECLLGVRI